MAAMAEILLENIQEEAPWEIATVEIAMVSRIFRREGLNRSHGILVVASVSHSTGDSYGWRYFAIPKGAHRIQGEDIVIGDEPVTVSEIDRNAPHGFALPKGSSELTWQPRRAARYSY